MSSAENKYDFIVVGSGPAGCALAAGLAKSAQRPQVLLLEAGGRNDDRRLRVDGKRWTTFMEEQDLNWGYKTTPQEHCNGRELDYSRGKGLGGGSAINFGLFTVGAKDDYDEWAAGVDDETFGWKQMQRRFKNLETFNGHIVRPEHRKYAAAAEADHGHTGGLRIGYAENWEKDLSTVLDAFEEAGFERNADHNSGNPLGMALSINSAGQGKRTTAADLLVGASDNLAIVTDSPVQRVILDGKRTVGVETSNKKYFASKEVILSAGSLDTPKILMHSGIGPASDLTKYNIPVIHDQPALGKGLRDHYFAPLILARKPETTDRNAFFKDPSAMESAMKQWEESNTGQWTRYGCQLGAGWFKSDKITSSAEFKALPTDVQEFMNRATIPHYEMLTHLPMHFFAPDMFKEDYSYVGLAAFMMNEQSRGEVTLNSSDPHAPLLFNPRFLEDPFDRRACIEMYRHLLEVSRTPAFAKDTVSTLIGPASESDEDILTFWKDFLSSSWHMTGTAKMGRVGEKEAVVDRGFRVIGLQGLRIADMSVVPVLTNNHTQATAYVTGATAADVLIREYGLDERVTAKL